MVQVVYTTHGNKNIYVYCICICIYPSTIIKLFMLIGNTLYTEQALCTPNDVTQV